MALTPEEVRGVAFRATRFRSGYDEEQVDAFLDRVDEELSRLGDENQSLRADNERLRQQLAELTGRRGVQEPVTAPLARSSQPPAPPRAPADGHHGSSADTPRRAQ